MTDAAAVVYRVFDASGRLLYVGCTVDFAARLREHSAHAPWWVFHDRVDSTRYTTRGEAAKAEAIAITTEHPRWNMRGRSDAHPDGKAYAYTNASWLDYDRDVSMRHRELVGEEQRLLAAIRKVRMGLAGVRAEAESIKNGFVLEDEGVA